MPSPRLLFRPHLSRPHLARLGLPERLLAVLLLVTVADFALNTVIFERTSAVELRREDAARVAENLVLAARAIERAPVSERAAAARALSSPRFSLRWSPAEAPEAEVAGLASLRHQIVAIAPELARARLGLHLERPRVGSLVGSLGGGAIGGSMVLRDAGVLRFGTYAHTARPLTPMRIVAFVLPTLLLAALAWVLLRQTLRPLKLLIQATREVGAQPPRPVPEHGPEEMRALIRAVNQMQQRIYQAFLDRTQTMLAVGHDLRTPLARMQLRLDAETLDRQTRGELDGDLAEMRHLIDSLQAYVESGGGDVPPVRIDLAAMAATLVDTAADLGSAATYEGPDHLEIVARPVAIRRALGNLIDNALHYGGSAQVALGRDGDQAVLTVADDGPGIPEDRLADVLQPFVRLDAARARTTPGMGLGLTIVSRAVQQEGGALALGNRPGGGLAATIRLRAEP